MQGRGREVGRVEEEARSSGRSRLAYQSRGRQMRDGGVGKVERLQREGLPVLEKAKWDWKSAKDEAER